MAETSFRCTAIVPTLAREDELFACLRSLAAASPGYEAVIVADQSPTDALRSRVEALGARYRHLEARGLSRARNAALALATTPWIHFPDDDCTVAPDLLAVVGEAVARRPATGFVAARVLTPEGRPIMKGMDERGRMLLGPADALATVMSPGLFAAARIFERGGGFDERFGVGAEWPSGEESDLLFRAFAMGESGLYVPRAIVTHPDPLAVRDVTGRRERAYRYGRGWGALFAKHAAAAGGARYEALRRHYERRALGGAVLALLSLRFEDARRHALTWRGRRAGFREWNARGGDAGPSR